MKPRFKQEITKLKEKLSELESKETNYTKYLNSGVNLLQNLRQYYEAASIPNKQKLVGSIFPENFTIENGKCRTAKENAVICVLRGFERNFKKERASKTRSFLSGSPYGNRTRVTRMKIWCPNP
jgi:site-specific DNA recombinase